MDPVSDVLNALALLPARSAANLAAACTSLDAVQLEAVLELAAAKWPELAAHYTARPIVHALMAALAPTCGDKMCDPACGSGGFLIEAERRIEDSFGANVDWSEKAEARIGMLTGADLSPDALALCRLNLRAHGVNAALGPEPLAQRSFTLLATDPGPGIDGEFLLGSLALLAPGGRAAVVTPRRLLSVPEAEPARRALLEQRRLHTILRLPQNQCAWLFNAGYPWSRHRENWLWVYDMDTGGSLDDFVACFRPGRIVERAEAAHWNKHEYAKVTVSPLASVDL